MQLTSQFIVLSEVPNAINSTISSSIRGAKCNYLHNFQSVFTYQRCQMQLSSQFLVSVHLSEVPNVIIFTISSQCSSIRGAKCNYLHNFQFYQRCQIYFIPSTILMLFNPLDAAGKYMSHEIFNTLKKQPAYWFTTICNIATLWQLFTFCQPRTASEGLKIARNSLYSTFVQILVLYCFDVCATLLHL